MQRRASARRDFTSLIDQLGKFQTTKMGSFHPAMTSPSCAAARDSACGAYRLSTKLSRKIARGLHDPRRGWASISACGPCSRLRVDVSPQVVLSRSRRPPTSLNGHKRPVTRSMKLVTERSLVLRVRSETRRSPPSRTTAQTTNLAEARSS